MRGTPRDASSPRGLAGALPRAAAASLLVPGLGQLLQRRRFVGACHVAAAAGVYAASWQLRAHGVPPLGVLCAITLLSAADAVRAERLARRPQLRVV